MSLFVINRYEGEREEASDETNHLSRLLNRIEERKRQKSQSKTQNAVESSLDDGDSKSQNQQKTKKKRKLDDGDDASGTTEDVGKSKGSRSENRRETKKKRKSDEGDDASGTTEDVGKSEDSRSENQQKTKKKKQKKLEEEGEGNAPDINTVIKKKELTEDESNVSITRQFPTETTDNIKKTEDSRSENQQKTKKKKKKLEEEGDAPDVNTIKEKEKLTKDESNVSITRQFPTGTTDNIKKTKDESIKVDSTNEATNSNRGPTDFVILGSKGRKRKKEVRRVLPEWLAKPEIVSKDLDSGVSLQGISDSVLDKRIVELLKSNNAKRLFPVQERTLEWLVESDAERRSHGFWIRDVCVSAPTGSGKTLAYVLPVIQILKSRIVPKIRCLVVVPVQELAAQVYKVMTTYTACTDLKVGLLSGASGFGQEQSNIVKKNSRGEYISLVDIIIATPGRLIDHVFKTPGFSLDELRFLVIDEADKNADWLEYIPEQHYRPPRLNLASLRDRKMPAQKLLFSATLTQDPEKLSRLGLLRPILFTSVLVTNKDGDVDLDKESGDFIGRYTSPDELREKAVECSSEYKPVALYHLLTIGKGREAEGSGRNFGVRKTLVFTNSGDTAHRLSTLLKSMLEPGDVNVGELSARFAPREREQVLKSFVDNEIQILVCSDALARGVDIPGVELVVSYDLPKHIKGYIHRAGRTGRAGKRGTAISILTSKQVPLFKQMLTTARKQVPTIKKIDDDELARIDLTKHLERLKNILEKEKVEQLGRVKSARRRA